MTTATLLHWALLDIVQAITLDGYKIYVYTNNPCHLWMRWTKTKTQKHITLKKERGVYIGKGARYCFVVYEDNEQEEPLDTLLHTFIKEPWTCCETRYFYFFGTVGGVDSPSESPIFWKHRPCGLLFAEPYDTIPWTPTPIFGDSYTVDFNVPWTLKFTEVYSW